MKGWQVLWRLVRFRPGLYALDVVLEMAAQVIILATGLAVREYFNILTGDTQVAWGVTGLIAVLLAAAMIRIILNSVGYVVDVTAYYNYAALLRKNLFAGILQQPGARALRYTPGETVSRLMGDVDGLVNFLGVLVGAIGTCAVAFTALTFMLRISPSITLVTILPLLMVGVVMNSLSGRIQMYRRANRTAAGQVGSFIAEIFGAVQAIQVATAEKLVIRRFHSFNLARRKAALRERMFNEILNTITGNLANVGIGIVLLLMGQSLRTGVITIGDFALFVYLIFWALQLPAAMGRIWAGYKQVDVSFARLAELLPDAPPAGLVKPGSIYVRASCPLPRICPKRKQII